MPDFDHRNAIDIDALFEDLVADVDARARARGADLAIRTSGRRRWAAASGALVTVVVLVGLVIVAVEPPMDRAEPVAPPSLSSDGLPDPRSFDAVALGEATDGWLTGWRSLNSPVVPDSSCTPKESNGLKPLTSSGSEYRAGKTVLATRSVAEFATVDQAERAFDAAAQLAPRCLGMGLVFYSLTRAWDEGMSSAYIYEGDHSSSYTFTVRFGSKLTFLTVAGDTTKPPDTVEVRVTDALIADLRS